MARYTKREDKARTLSRKAERSAKYVAQGRVTR